MTVLPHITDAERRRRLAQRHLLLPAARVDRLEDVADALVALHSSDPASVYLSAAARMNGTTLAALEHALYDERSVVRHHAMRRTLWVMSPEVARLAHAAYTRRIAVVERKRTAKLFGRDDAWVAGAIERVADVVERAGGPIGTREIGGLIPDLAEPVTVGAGKPYETTMAAHTRAALMAAFEARIARSRPNGTWIGSQYAWVAHSDWVDWIDDDLDEMSATSEMVRRWLVAFGPGTLTDIVWWSGATKTLTRRALESLDVTDVLLDDGETGYVMADDLAAPEHDEPWVALLPGLDPTAMGWKQRAWYLPADVVARVTDRNGNIGPTVWVDGHVVGGWVQRPDGSIGHDAPDLDATHRRLLDVEVDRLQTLVGDSRFTVRFPAPNQRPLLAG